MPPMRPTPEDLAHVQTLASVATMRYALMEAFPDSFGGLYNSDGQSRFVVLVVGAAEEQAAIHRFVADYLKQASPTDSIPTPITYAYAAHSLASLFALRDRIIAAARSVTQGSTSSLPQVLGAGIDDKNNTVQVKVPLEASADQATTALQAAYQSDAIQAVPSAPITVVPATPSRLGEATEAQGR
jgi:hypothetical protein